MFLVGPNNEKIELFMISRFDSWDDPANGTLDDQYHLLRVATSKPLDPNVTYTVLRGDPSNPTPAVSTTYPHLRT